MARPTWLRRLARASAWVGGFGLLTLGIAAVPALYVARDWAAEGEALADAHARYEVAHPGWSFPAHVVSRPTPLSASPKRLIAEAKARGYTETCPVPGPGEFCAKTQTVVPRAGASELEPIELGWLFGPDAEIRYHLPLEDAPELLVLAIIAAEDRDFREHRGVNVSSMVRAVLANAQEGGYAQGGSTLTMQVVRNLNQRKEKTVQRKLQEMVMAWAIDRHLGKEGVLQMYLDAPYLGQRGSLSVCGFEAASLHYFGHSARELTLAEAATLAGILPAPGKFAPDRFPDKAKERRDRVLTAMHEVFGVAVEEALAAPVETSPPPAFPERYPGYLSATRAWLESHVSPTVLYGSGLTVEVGLDVVAQEEADQLFPAKTRYFESLIGRKRQDEPMQAAGVLLDVETGLVRAVYGGTDVTAISFNRATQAMRQPGSSFKPLTYAMAFELRDADGKPRFTAASTEPNSPRDFKTPQGNWRPRNVGGEYTTTACLAEGLTWSQNIATASLLEDAGGPKALIAFAAKLGFDTSKFPEEMGLCLGQGEVTPLAMAQLAGVLSNGGYKLDASPVARATDAGGVERVSPPQKGDAVVSPEAAALTRELMKSVIEVGTGGASRGAGGEGGYQGPAMGKTGTTDGEKDLWFVGATPTLAMAVWVGYDTPTPLGVAASDLAAPLWGWWMNRVTRADLTEKDPTSGAVVYPKWPEEPKILKRSICKESGKLLNGTCPGISAPFIEGTVPKQGCGIEHPPPELEGVELDAAGNPKPKHESLWKRLQREQQEAAGAVPAVAPSTP